MKNCIGANRRTIENDGRSNGMNSVSKCVCVCVGIQNQVAEQIQVLWPHVHQDVLTRLNAGCESFRGELETHLCGLRDVHGRLAQ